MTMIIVLPSLTHAVRPVRVQQHGRLWGPIIARA